MLDYIVCRVVTLIFVVLFIITNADTFAIFFFFQAEDGIRDLVRSRGLGDVYKRQPIDHRVDRDSGPHDRAGRAGASAGGVR